MNAQELNKAWEIEVQSIHSCLLELSGFLKPQQKSNAAIKSTKKSSSPINRLENYILADIPEPTQRPSQNGVLPSSFESFVFKFDSGDNQSNGKKSLEKSIPNNDSERQTKSSALSLNGATLNESKARESAKLIVPEAPSTATIRPAQSGFIPSSYESFFVGFTTLTDMKNEYENSESGTELTEMIPHSLSSSLSSSTSAAGIELLDLSKSENIGQDPSLFDAQQESVNHSTTESKLADNHSTTESKLAESKLAESETQESKDLFDPFQLNHESNSTENPELSVSVDSSSLSNLSLSNRSSDLPLSSISPTDLQSLDMQHEEEIRDNVGAETNNLADHGSPSEADSLFNAFEPVSNASEEANVLVNENLNNIGNLNSVSTNSITTIEPKQVSHEEVFSKFNWE